MSDGLGGDDNKDFRHHYTYNPFVKSDGTKAKAKPSWREFDGERVDFVGRYLLEDSTKEQFQMNKNQIPQIDLTGITTQHVDFDGLRDYTGSDNYDIGKREFTKMKINTLPVMVPFLYEINFHMVFMVILVQLQMQY